MVTCTTPPFRAAVRLNSGVRPRQSDLRNKSNSTQLFRNVPRRFARAPLAYSPTDTFKQARQIFIRRRRCGLSLRSFVPGSSPAGARGNKPCRACLRASVRFLRDQFGFAVKAKAGQRPNNSFKPSPLRGLGAGSYDSAIAVAATLPGLTQALGLSRIHAHIG